MVSEDIRAQRRRKWVILGFLILLAMAGFVVFEGWRAATNGPGKRGGSELVIPANVVPTHLPDGFTLARLMPGGGPPSHDMRWAYFGEAGRANPFEQRDLLIVTTLLSEVPLFRDEGDPVEVLDTTGRFMADDRELGFPVNKLQFAQRSFRVTMLSRHLGRAELISLTKSVQVVDYAFLGEPKQGLTPIAEPASGPLGANESGRLTYSSYERGDEYIRLASGEPASIVTAAQWWGSEATTIGKQPVTRTQVNLEGEARDVITYSWINSTDTAVTVFSNIDDASLRKVVEGVRSIKGSKRQKMAEEIFAVSDPFGRAAPSPSVIDGNGLTQSIKASWRTPDGDWYYGRQGEQHCLTVWTPENRQSKCDPLVSRPGELPSLSMSFGGKRFFIVRLPKSTTPITVESSTGHTVAVDRVDITDDQFPVYLGRVDESDVSGPFSVRIADIFAKVTTSTFRLT